MLLGGGGVSAASVHARECQGEQKLENNSEVYFTLINRTVIHADLLTV